MRLRSVDGPLSIDNGNNLLNSPKRLNIIQNSNINFNSSYITTSTTSTSTSTITTNKNINGTTEELLTLNNINNTQSKVQWCNISQKIQELNNQNNNNNKNNNINNNNSIINNNNLATSIRNVRRETVSSIYSESSPDDSYLEYDDAQQGVSSIDQTPQDEDRAFDISDSELSDDGNVVNNTNSLHQTKGIVNPNYPGFQHLAHTLNFKSTSDLSDEEFDNGTTLNNIIDENNINNNNIEETNYNIESVNRLDSVENIQKVFYDKPVFNVVEECESETNSSITNPNSDEDNDFKLNTKCNDNVNNIIGDFGKEVEQEFGRISLDLDNFEDEILTLEEAQEENIEENDENFDCITNHSPIKYNIQLNLEQHLPPVIKSTSPMILNDTITMTIPSKLEDDKKKDEIIKSKTNDAFLSNAQDTIALIKEHLDSNRELKEIENQLKKIKSNTKLPFNVDNENFCKEEITKNFTEKDEDCSIVPNKRGKTDYYVKRRCDYNQQIGSLISFPRREFGRSRDLNRRSIPMVKKRSSHSDSFKGAFDVYNIETAMPKIDLDAIESHLRASREEERRRRTDREEIRRRLAMGSEDDYYSDRPGRKPSLQARLQSGMNLQICFMNETVSDTESSNSDNECSLTNLKKQSKTTPKSPIIKDKLNNVIPTRPVTLSLGQPLLPPLIEPLNEMDFFTRQARLQTEARMALAQAKEMARMQMEIERQRQKKSPITEMVRHSLEKIGIPFPDDKRRLSRQILTEMNVAQLQVIVNDLHTQIETLNENLVKFLMDRDDLHMEQDSMLVDIEDLTRYLGAKEQVIKEQNLINQPNNNIPPPSPAPSSPLTVINNSVKPHLHRIASLVKK